jgi:hypothetical protein
MNGDCALTVLCEKITHAKTLRRQEKMNMEQTILSEIATDTLKGL